MHMHLDQFNKQLNYGSTFCTKKWKIIDRTNRRCNTTLFFLLLMYYTPNFHTAKWHNYLSYSTKCLTYVSLI